MAGFVALTPEKGTIQPLRHNEKISGLALLGTVLDTRDTYVKIHLRIDETQDVNTAKWFPYASEANNLFYCMPEIGQNLSLYFSNADENSAIAINSVRRNGCNCADMTDPALKRMTASPSGHTFGLGQGDIDFTKHEGLFITLSDGVTVKSDTDIMIAGQKITLSATEKVMITAQKSLVVGSGANAQVYLSEETGDANLIAPGMVKFDAEGGSPLEPFSRSIGVDAVPEPCPPPSVPWWQRALAFVAVVVIVVAVVKTGGLLLAAAPLAAKGIIGAATATGALLTGYRRASTVAAAGGCWRAQTAAFFGGALDGAVSWGMGTLQFLSGGGALLPVFQPMYNVAGTLGGGLLETLLGTALGVRHTLDDNPFLERGSWTNLGFDVVFGIVMPLIKIAPPGIQNQLAQDAATLGIGKAIEEFLKGVLGIGGSISDVVSGLEQP